MRSTTKHGGFLQLISGSAKDFSRDQCALRAAALCYYTVFALPPLLILLIKVAGAVWSPEAVQRALESQFAGLIGAGGAQTVREMVSAGQSEARSVLTTILGVAGLLFGATGAFIQLQQALNAAWEVGPDPKAGGVMRFLTKRLLSLAMVMGLGFLLVVSLAVSAVLSAVGGRLGNGVLMQVLNYVVSTAVLGVMFAAMFKFLPDAVVPWRSVLVGGFATAVLFGVGKLAIGLYLGRSNPGNAFGAASALAVILVWIYYAGMLFLFGAEFTQRYAASKGHAIEPKHGAVRIERPEQIVHRDRNDRTRSREGSMQDSDENGRGRRMTGNGASAMDGASNARLRDASIGELFKLVSTDSSHLMKQEIALAKTEVRQAVSAAGATGAKLGIAAMVALPGIMAVTAAAVIGLGILIGSYWGSALIVGAVMLAVSGFLAKRALAGMKGGLIPETIKTVREDVDWAKEEMPRVKQQLSA